MRRGFSFTAASLLALLLTLLCLPACAPAALPVTGGTPTPFQPYLFTPTAFLPLPPTDTPAPEPAAAQPQPSLRFHGIDFNDTQSWVEIIITPPDETVNRGRPIRMRFKPGAECNFGSQRACVSAYLQPDGSEVIFLSIHSGVGGQAQSYRHAVEGTGINQAGFSLAQTLQNLQSLKGASVGIRQNDVELYQFTLLETARIPASGLSAYFAAPISQALPVSGFSTPPGDAGQPLLVFETCGWHMPGESRADAVSGTTASVYLAVIQ
ncbi:MAG: hypothetical protein GYA48_12475 [Chloroflexi bacterium]|nr:hypothetical protein [Chloroflexota bacterium]